MKLCSETTKGEKEMSRYLKRVEDDDLNISREAKNILADSTITFYQDGQEYYYSDIYHSNKCPIANLTHVGSIENVEWMLTGEE